MSASKSAVFSIFSLDVVSGALDSFKDGTEVGLVQIVKGTDWKGVRFDLESPPQPHNYPVKRGTYFPLSANEALLGVGSGYV